MIFLLIHVVKRGESLWQIAANYRIPMQDIINANQLLSPSQLAIGQALVIPMQDLIHVVQAGETVWRIALEYGSSVQAIIAANNLTNPNSLYPGQRLYIPAKHHLVQAGETLWAIAQKYGVALQDLISVNKIQNPNQIHPGMILVIPHKGKKEIEVNGYQYFFLETKTVKENGKLLTYLSPFAYLIKEDGTMQEINDTPLISVAYRENVVPMMAITNFTSTQKGENLAHVILANQELQDKLLTNILKIMQEKGYQGLNIDFENVLPADRELYNNFLKRAVELLHQKGYFVSTALAPKVSGEQTGALYEAHDYRAHGKIADFVILMTYEWGYRKGPPQAISPIDKIKEVLDYAITVIPKEKIFFGFQIYARDWLIPHVAGQEAETFSPQAAELRAYKYGATIEYDTTSESPYYRYQDKEGRMHEVWFEDARSAQARFNLVKDLELKGISYWALGYSFPQNWALLQDNFVVKKL